MTTVHWAQRHSRPVQGALLATPPDFGSPLPDGYPMLDELYDNGWCPAPCDPLPFPSILAASSNDPLARIDRVAALAAAWESRWSTSARSATSTRPPVTATGRAPRNSSGNSPQPPRRGTRAGRDAGGRTATCGPRTRRSCQRGRPLPGPRVARRESAGDPSRQRQRQGGLDAISAIVRTPASAPDPSGQPG